ncbi:hypothetical protein BH10PSE12_BH10PSE12_20010 [soil metagenome]
MIARLLLALMLACLALPALAGPMVHDAEPAGTSMTMAHAGMDHGDHHTGPAPSDKTTPEKSMQHGCIGCIPPSNAFARPVSPAGFALALRHARPNTAAPPACASAPETPPPKALS